MKGQYTMNKSESIVKLAESLAKAQAEMPPVKFNATNPFLKNKYADLGALIETAQPIMAKHALAVSQLVYSEEDKIGVETVLMHASGEYISTTLSMAMVDEKGKSSAQVAGSIITYLRRYSLAAILGMYADEDGDGNAAPRPTAAPVQKKVEDSQAPVMTLERALIQTNSEGVKYADLPSEKLQAMQLGINKALKNNNLNPEDKKVYEDKLAASKAILAARRSGEIS